MNNFWLLWRLWKLSWNYSPSPVKFWFHTGSIHWVVRSCTTAANCKLLFRDSLLRSTVVKSPVSSVRGIDLFRYLRKWLWMLCFHFLCHHFWSITFRFWDLSFRGMCVTNRERLALAPPCTFRLKFFRMLVHGFPACQDLSASVSRMHACHFGSWLDLIIVPIFWNNFTDELISMLKTHCSWNRWQSWYGKKYEIVHCTSNWLPICGQSWSLPFFHSNEYLCFEQSISSNRTAGVSPSNRTVTNRSKSWTKLVRPRLFALSQSRLNTVVGFLDLLKESILSELKSLLLRIVLFLPSSTLLLLSQSACREVSSSVSS